MRRGFLIIISAVFLLGGICPFTAHAGWLDKMKKGTEELGKVLDKKEEPKQPPQSAPATEKKTATEDRVSKEEYFSWVKQQILKHPTLRNMPTRPEKVVVGVLANDYDLRIPDQCRALPNQIVVVMDMTHMYYQAHLYNPNTIEYRKERVAQTVADMKQCASRYNVSEDELSKIMEFLRDYDQVVASAYEEVQENWRKEEKLKQEQELKQTEEARLREEREAKQEEEAWLKEKQKTKNRIGAIIQKATKNHAELAKASKKFRKDVSGVWYAKGVYYTIDLLSPNRIIMVNNTTPAPVQIADFDKDRRRIVVYATKDGKISIREDGRLYGRVIKKIMTGGREFKLGISETDGIKVDPERIFSFVRDLKF